MSLQLRDTRYNDIQLIFREDGHKYTDTLGNEYLSTTTFLHNYQQPFEYDYWLRKKAKELKISPKVLANQWDSIKNEACDRGTRTHNGLEDGIKDSSMFKNAIRYLERGEGKMITVADLPNINNRVKELDIEEFKRHTNYKYEDVYKVFDFYTSKGYKIYSEIGAFLIDYLISGTIDVLCIKEDKFVIGDWKTNRGGLKFESGYYKKDKQQKPAQQTNVWCPKDSRLLPPVSNLQDCNGSIYNLQLSMYAWMVESILGIPCAGLWLCHIDSDFILNEYGMPKRFPDGLYHIKDNPVEKVTLHKMKYLKQEIANLLRDRRKAVNATINKEFSLF